MLGTLTAILPGAHTDDNGPIAAGELVQTTVGPDGITVDVNAAANAAGTATLGQNLFGSSGDSPLMTETNP